MTFEINLNDEDFKTVSNADLLKISDEIISQRQKVYEALAK